MNNIHKEALLYKDLKSLYKPGIYLEKKAIENFLYLSLKEIAPLLKKDIDWFLKFLSNQSKQSLDKVDSKGLFRGDIFAWNSKYIELPIHYSKLNRKCRFILRKSIMDEDDDKEIEQITLQEWLKDLREGFKEFLDDIEQDIDLNYDQLIEEFSNPHDKFTLRVKEFIELSFASIFNHISLVQNKATITNLLRKALQENQIKNFKKIFDVDPSVFDLPEVQNYINHQDRKTKAQINKYYSDSINIPIISNTKNKVSQKPMMIIGIMDSIGLINGELKLSKTRLLTLGTLAGIDHDSIDQTYFNKLLLHVKKK